MNKEFLHQELEVAQAGGGVKDGSRKSRVAKIFTTGFFSFSILLSVAAISFAIVFVIHEVAGPSMLNSLNSNWNPALVVSSGGRRQDNNTRDMVLVNSFSNPKHGDIITVRYPWPPGTSGFGGPDGDGLFVKRVIGLEGDRIRFERVRVLPGEITHSFTPFRYRLVRNDKIIYEDYDGFDHSHYGVMAFYGDNFYEYINGRAIPHVVHGDFVSFRNREVNGMPIVRPDLQGRMELHVPPGEIFYMGDNRGTASSIAFSQTTLHSLDSTAFGPQPISLVTGVRAATIEHDKSIPEFIWEQIVAFFSFRWLF